MSAKFSIFLAFLLATTLSQASEPLKLQDSLSPRQLGSYYVTKDGVVNLQKDSIGFYVYVDFNNQYNEASDSEGYDPSIATMGLGLYTSQTLLVQSCFDFNEYFCTNFGCSAYTWWYSEFNLPYFSVTGYYASAQVYLDYGNWELESYATVATSCSSNYYYPPFGTLRYGVVGLGLNSSTSSNFIGASTMFSIWLSKDMSSGTLMFSENTNGTSSSSSLGSLITDSQWHVTPSYMELGISSNTESFYASAIFDIDADALGFPSTAFSSLISTLSSSVSSLSCGSATYKPTCSYNGKIGDLPTLQLTVQGIQISLPPGLYVEDYDESDTVVDGTITLNLKALDGSYDDQSFVTSDYENYVIFDQNFMSYYYTEFSYASGSYQISLYPQYDTSSKNHIIWPFIVGGVLGFIVLISIICCCVKRRNKRIRDQSRARLFENDSLINDSNIPPQVNTLQETQGPNIPYPSQNYPAYDNYNQGNYGYPQQFPPQQYPPQQYPPQQYPYNFNNPQGGAYNYNPPQGQYTGETR